MIDIVFHTPRSRLALTCAPSPSHGAVVTTFHFGGAAHRDVSWLTPDELAHMWSCRECQRRHMMGAIEAAVMCSQVRVGRVDAQERDFCEGVSDLDEDEDEDEDEGEGGFDPQRVEWVSRVGVNSRRGACAASVRNR